jgi:histidine triad (HIT) family protein
MPRYPSVQEPCIFCRLLDGSELASLVYRDDRCAVFMDIQPINPGHMLVVPNEHAPSMADLDADMAAHLMRVAHQLMAALRASGFRCEGVNLMLADGEAAGQSVFHVHLHVVPRYQGDGFGHRFGPHYTKRPRTELDDAARLIRQALAGNGCGSTGSG